MPQDAAPDATPNATAEDAASRRSYVRVLVIWVAVLLALYAFQQHFS